MSKLSRKLRRSGSKNVLIKQAEMAAQVLSKESESASRALMMHALYHARYGALPEEYLKAAWDEMLRTSGPRNMTSKEFFEKGVQAGLVALRELVTPSEERAESQSPED